MTVQNTMTPSAVDIESSPRIQADSQHGVIGSWWQLGIGMSESTCSFMFGLAQDTRAEVRRRTDVTLTFAEEMGVGGFRFLRKIVDRVDRMSGETLGRAEAAFLVVTRTLRKTGHGVTDLASSAISDTIGSSMGQRSSKAAA